MIDFIHKTARTLAERMHDVFDVFSFTDDEKFCAHLKAVNEARCPTEPR